MGLKRKMKAHRSRLEMLEEMRKSNEKVRKNVFCLNPLYLLIFPESCTIDRIFGVFKREAGEDE